MLNYLIDNTDLLEYLSLHDLSEIRQTRLCLKHHIDKRICLNNTNWIQKCRMYNPNDLWEINGKMASCYKPLRNKWIMIYWQKKLPSIVPKPFWNYFLQFMKGFVSLYKFQQWCHFEQIPLILPNKKEKWEVKMKMEIVGASIHNNNEEYPEELRDIDEFIAVGITLHRTRDIKNGILGLNSFSIGWHSDDGIIYMDSLMIDKGELFGKGDKIELILDYQNGILMFSKNSKLVYYHELSGEFICNPLTFSVSCRTMNSLFLSII